MDGFVHCDPHPVIFISLTHKGNIMLSPKNNGDFDVVLLDNGLYREYDSDFRDNYARLWLAILRADEEKIKKYAMLIGGVSSYKMFTSMLTTRSWETYLLIF
jgi:aarF domain-containing kinase